MKLVGRFIAVLALLATSTITPAFASHGHCDAKFCIALGGSQPFGSTSFGGEWQSKREAYANKIAICNLQEDRTRYVEMYTMIRLKNAFGGYIDVPIGETPYRSKPTERCTLLREHWTIMSSADYEQVGIIQKYRTTDGIGAQGEALAPSQWYYTNWDYNPYYFADCPECKSGR